MRIDDTHRSFPTVLLTALHHPMNLLTIALLLVFHWDWGEPCGVEVVMCVVGMSRRRVLQNTYASTAFVASKLVLGCQSNTQVAFIRLSSLKPAIWPPWSFMLFSFYMGSLCNA